MGNILCFPLGPRPLHAGINRFDGRLDGSRTDRQTRRLKVSLIDNAVTMMDKIPAESPGWVEIAVLKQRHRLLDLPLPETGFSLAQSLERTADFEQILLMIPIENLQALSGRLNRRKEIPDSILFISQTPPWGTQRLGVEPICQPSISATLRCSRFGVSQ